MSGSIVTWADYQGQGLANMGGFADMGQIPHSASDLDALNKALAAGSDINNPGVAAGEGFPLRVESLDRTLFNVTYAADDILFWKALFKEPAYNTVEEYNRLEAYGSGDSVNIGEGELAPEDDSTYSRQYTKIKFMGTTRRVTHVMSLLKAAHGDAVAREQVNGTLFLLRQLERQLFVGDERLVDLQFDGLETLMTKAFNSGYAEDQQSLGYEDMNVIDCRGAPPSEDLVTDLVERLRAEPNYARPTDLWLPTGPMKDLSKTMYPKERIALPAPNMGTAGIAIDRINTNFGMIKLNPDIFIPDSVLPGPALGKSSLRPGSPTLGSLTSPVYSGSNRTFFAAPDEGTYHYKVVAGSRWGRSAAVVSSGAVTVSAGDQVSIPVTDVGPDTSYYEVYRSERNGPASTCRSIFRVPRTGPTQVIVDLNRFLPNTSKGYMLSFDREVLKIKQLAPFTKIPLAQIDTSIRWTQVLYLALQLMKPRWNGMFINIGKLPTGANA